MQRIKPQKSIQEEVTRGAGSKSTRGIRRKSPSSTTLPPRSDRSMGWLAELSPPYHPLNCTRSPSILPWCYSLPRYPLFLFVLLGLSDMLLVSRSTGEIPRERERERERSPPQPQRRSMEEKAVAPEKRNRMHRLLLTSVPSSSHHSVSSKKRAACNRCSGPNSQQKRKRSAVPAGKRSSGHPAGPRKPLSALHVH